MYDSSRSVDADEIIITDYRKPSFIDFALQLRQSWHFDFALSLTEYGALVAARINERLGVRGSNVASILCLNDKETMRKVLQQVDFSPLAYRVLRQRQDVADFCAEAGLPLILKPVDGGGSHGIHLAHDTTEALAAWDTLHAEGNTVLAEQFADGQEYSVEAFTFEGKHRIIAITQKVVNTNFVEVGHLMPAMLDPAREEEIAAFTRRFLEIAGVTNGPSHTELKVGSHGFRIIESHNRPGGGNIARLMHEVYGVDIVKLSALWASGQHDGDLGELTPNGAAAIHFFLFNPGQVLAVEGLSELARHPAVIDHRCYFGPGSRVPTSADNSARAGYVIVRHPEQQQAMELAASLAAGVRATIDQHEQKVVTA